MATPKKTTAPKKVTETKKGPAPLIIEQHPADYTGFPFVTLIQYRKQPMLAIVDNIKDDVMFVFVLDLCEPARVNEEMLISAATEWYENNRSKFPISIEFSQRGLTPHTSRIYRALNVEFISRIIGPVPKYPMSTTKSIKRRRRKTLPTGVEIHKSGTISLFDQLAE
jgi:hypothetical protein